MANEQPSCEQASKENYAATNRERERIDRTARARHYDTNRCTERQYFPRKLELVFGELADDRDRQRNRPGDAASYPVSGEDGHTKPIVTDSWTGHVTFRPRDGRTASGRDTSRQ